MKIFSVIFLMSVANLQMHKVFFRLIFTQDFVRKKQIITCGDEVTGSQKILCIYLVKQSTFQYLVNHQPKLQRWHELLLTGELAITLALYIWIVGPKEIGAVRLFAFDSDKL